MVLSKGGSSKTAPFFITQINLSIIEVSGVSAFKGKTQLEKK